MRNIHTNHGTLTDPHSIATKIRAILLSHPIPSKLSHPMHDLTHATQYLNWNQTPATLGTEEERPLEPQPVTHNGVPHAHHTKSKKEKERIKKHPQRSTLLSTHEWQHYKYTCPTLQSQATQRVKGDPFKNRHRPHSRKRLDRKGLCVCLGCGGLPLGGVVSYRGRVLFLRAWACIRAWARIRMGARGVCIASVSVVERG